MTEEQQMLQTAASEIKYLRRRNELMAARLGVFDSMMSIFNASKNCEQTGMTEDIVWKIDKHLSEVTK